MGVAVQNLAPTPMTMTTAAAAPIGASRHAHGLQDATGAGSRRTASLIRAAR